MPYKKKRSTAAARRIQRAWRRKRYRKRRIARAVVNKTGITGKAGTHLVRQKVYDTYQIPAGGIPFYLNKTFQLSDLPQYTTFTRLYDEYCIYAVSHKIILNSNTAIDINQNLQLGYVLNERDASAFPATWSEFMERAAVKIKSLYPSGRNACQATMYIKPRPLTQLYESTTSTGYKINNRKVWCDMGDPTVPHYGLLYGFNNGIETLNYPIDVTVITTYYLGFKGLQ